MGDVVGLHEVGRRLHGFTSWYPLLLLHACRCCRRRSMSVVGFLPAWRCQANLPFRASILSSTALNVHHRPDIIRHGLPNPHQDDTTVLSMSP
jgi:hypothetical protein